MKKKERILNAICPFLVTIAVCVCTAIAFGTVTYLKGGVINAPISNANGVTGYKYRVLEIEPCWGYIYDEQSYRSEMASALDCNESEIYFKYVSTAEFNGMNEDLVASYDVIVMGLNTDTMNKVNGSTIFNDRSLDGYIYLAYGDLVKYDDRLSGMLPADYIPIEKYFSGDVYENGYRLTFNNSIRDYNNYYNVGTMHVDSVGTTPTTDWKSKWHVFRLNNSSLWTPAMRQYYSVQNENFIVLNCISDKQKNDYSYWGNNAVTYYNDPLGNARFSGNDITKKKMNEIIDFVHTGRPIILADGLYTCVSDNNSSPNSNKAAYPTSNVYSLLTTINGKENVIKYSVYRNQLEAKLHDTVLEITNYTMTYGDDIPAPQVTYNGSLVDSSCIISGVEQFKYTVDFKATPGKQYFVKVLVDKDTDGRFDREATVDDFNEVYYATVLTAETENIHRDMEINLPKNYNGMFGWQILVEELDNARNPVDRVSVQGHTVVRGQTKVIKVLQLYSGVSQALIMTDGSLFDTYMDTAASRTGYDVSVTYMSVGTFEEQFIGKKYTSGSSYKTPNDYLNANGYNMLVIGFSDSFDHEDISDDNGALSCVLDYIKNGNSVLFSHDTMQFQPSGNMGIAVDYIDTYNGDWWGGNKSKTLHLKFTSGWNERSGLVMTLGMRDLVGMDRYNVTSMPTYSDQDKAAAGVPKKADGSYLYEIQGFSDLVLYWLNSNRNYVTNQRVNTVNTLLPHTSLTATNTAYDYIRTTRVEEVNEGQITMYPYDVTTDGFVNVDKTHSQYFQLDLEDDDVVVWYTLTSDGSSKGGPMYGYTRRDAANNYYIYSKGNITYTGAGHATGESGDKIINGAQELRLFVNTVIRAATAGNFIPTVKSYNGAITPVAGTYVVFPKPFDTEYLVEFVAYDEDLATRAVVQDSYPAAEVEQHIGRFQGGGVYWKDGDTLKPLKYYSRTGSADDYLLNGEVKQFYIYDPTTNHSTAEINADPLLKNMLDCYNAYNNNNQVDLVVQATDYYGETGSCIIQVVNQELFNLD